MRHFGCSFCIDLQGLIRGQCPRLIQLPHHMQQRVLRLFRLDLVARQIGGGHIGPGMAIQADRADVQEGRLAAGAHDVCRALCGAEAVENVQPVAGEVVQARAVAEAGRDPARRGFRGDSDAIVLAAEQQRQRHALIGRPLRRVERPLRRGMIGRGIAEAGEDKAIIGQNRMLGPPAPGRANRIGRPHRLGQMRGNGRGLRRNAQAL